MRTSAIRWAGSKEVIYGTSIRTIAESELFSYCRACQQKLMVACRR